MTGNRKYALETGTAASVVTQAVESEEPSAARLQAEFDYWNALICERVAAEFLRLSERTLQGLRQRGGSPKFIRISARCIRYRRIDLRAWADERSRSSTSEQYEENFSSSLKPANAGLASSASMTEGRQADRIIVGRDHSPTTVCKAEAGSPVTGSVASK